MKIRLILAIGIIALGLVGCSDFITAPGQENPESVVKSGGSENDSGGSENDSGGSEND